MKIVFNADDFGYSRAVNFGIIDSFKFGVVRSTSILVNTPGFEHAVKLYHENMSDGLGVGIHLNLMMGKPVSAMKLETLTDANGNFYKFALFDSNKDYFDKNEIETEFEAQIERAMAAGIRLTHIDSHYGIHMQNPIFEVAVKIAQKHDLPLRMVDANRNNPISKGTKTSDKFTGGFFAQNATFDYIYNYVNTHTQYDNCEILCRPAYVDLTLYNGTKYAVNRINEIEVLCDPQLKQFLLSNGHQIVNYGELFE